MRFLLRRRSWLALAVASVGLTATLAAAAGPGTVACVFIDASGLVTLPDGTRVEPGRSAEDHAALEQLLTEGRARIAQTFGAPRAQPIVVFLREAHLFGLPLNPYGSTSFIGTRACVVLGPKGHTPDIVAHELMHAELFARVGYWRRLTEIPTWFDEGLAMQVDERSAYAAPTGGTAFVRQLDTVRAFNATANDAQATLNYAAAKAEVAQWLTRVGAGSLYPRLERVGGGEAFALSP